jgi:hypothetical protein
MANFSKYPEIRNLLPTKWINKYLNILLFLRSISSHRSLNYEQQIPRLKPATKSRTKSNLNIMRRSNQRKNKKKIEVMHC